MERFSYSADRIFSELSNLQHGSASRSQLEANGVHRLTIDRHLEAGLWRPIAPAVFRHSTRPPDWKMLAVASLLEGHRDAVLGGATALAFHGIPDGVSLRLPPRLLIEHMKTHDTAIASVRQVNWWPENDIVQMGSSKHPWLKEVQIVSCTNAARSLVDIGCWADAKSFPAFLKLLDSSVRGQVVTYEQVLESAVLARTMRRRGVVKVIRAVEARVGSEAEASELEKLARRRFKKWGVVHLLEFEVPHPAYPGTKKRADAVCRTARLILEFDSRLHHLSNEGFETDRDRDGDGLEAGWFTLRITWAHLTSDVDRTRTRLRRLCGLDGGIVPIAS
jgi:hypothetical protein